jgi:hypothetical protein
MIDNQTTALAAPVVDGQPAVIDTIAILEADKIVLSNEAYAIGDMLQQLLDVLWMK